MDWNLINGILALLAIVIPSVLTILIFRWQQKKKALHVIWQGTVELVTAREAVSKDIEIRYRGQPVENLSALQIRVQNPGNVPILPGDFVKPLQITLEESPEIIEVMVSDQQPADLEIETTLDQSQSIVTIAPTLLNPSDAFVFNILNTAKATQHSSKMPFEVSARVAGVKEIEVTKNPIDPIGNTERLLIYYGAFATTVIIMFFTFFLTDYIYIHGFDLNRDMWRHGLYST